MASSEAALRWYGSIEHYWLVFALVSWVGHRTVLWLRLYWNSSIVLDLSLLDYQLHSQFCGLDQKFLSKAWPALDTEHCWSSNLLTESVSLLGRFSSEPNGTSDREKSKQYSPKQGCRSGHTHSCTTSCLHNETNCKSTIWDLFCLTSLARNFL